MQTGLVTWTTENQRRTTTSSSTDVAQQSARVSRSRPQLLFLHQKQNIRAWQQQWRHCIWNNFWRISASNINIQKQLARTTRVVLNCAKTSHAQEEQTHWDKISHHSGQDKRWDFFNSLRSYWKNGSRQLRKIFFLIEDGKIQICFDGNRLYAISSSLSGGVRISIKI